MSETEVHEMTMGRARIRTVGRRLNMEMALAALVGPVWAFVAAGALWRFAVQRWVPAVLAMFALIALAMTWALIRKRLLSESQAAIITDRRANAGGLLLTRLEIPVGDWEPALRDKVVRLTPPPIAIGRPALAIVAATIFLVVAMAIPLPAPRGKPANAAAATRVEHLVEQLAVAAKEEPVETNLKTELERLREELKDGKFDATDWEAADSLSRELDRKADEAAAELAKADEAARQLEQAMAKAQAGDRLDRERDELERALMQLSDGQASTPREALDQALKNGGPSDELPSSNDLKNGESKSAGAKNTDAKSGGKPSRAELDALKRAIAARQDRLAQSFGQNDGPRLAKQSKGESKRSSSPSEREGASVREPGDGNGDVGQAGRELSGSAAHGPGGDTKILSGDRAEIDPEKLKLAASPKGHGGEGTELWGLAAADPKRHAGGGPAPSHPQGLAGHESPANREGVALPRNKTLIQRYFDPHP
ncbi:MAG TPA: hypothetical protein VJT73_00040 [Polyangiaceae bacterium]|nr:hypothetical protein [Polyangiaceae bacterium]